MNKAAAVAELLDSVFSAVGFLYTVFPRNLFKK